MCHDSALKLSVSNIVLTPVPHIS